MENSRATTVAKVNLHSGVCRLACSSMFKPTNMVCAVEELSTLCVQWTRRRVYWAMALLVGGDRRYSKTTRFLWVTPQRGCKRIILKSKRFRRSCQQRWPTAAFVFPKHPRDSVSNSLKVHLNHDSLSSSENASLAAAWKEIFENAVTKEAETRSYLGRLGIWAMYKLKMMGLEPPKNNSIDFTQTWETVHWSSWYCLFGWRFSVN